MKEDILEQLVDDFLQTEGYFTRHATSNSGFEKKTAEKDATETTATSM